MEFCHSNRRVTKTSSKESVQMSWWVDSDIIYWQPSPWVQNPLSLIPALRSDSWISSIPSKQGDLQVWSMQLYIICYLVFPIHTEFLLHLFSVYLCVYTSVHVFRGLRSMSDIFLHWSPLCCLRQSLLLNLGLISLARLVANELHGSLHPLKRVVSKTQRDWIAWLAIPVGYCLPAYKSWARDWLTFQCLGMMEHHLAPGISTVGLKGFHWP